MMCKACSGESATVKDGKVVSRGCDECVAQALVKHPKNVMGIMSLEHAKKLCSCLANDHKGGKTVEPSEQFVTIHEEAKEYFKQQLEEQAIKQQKLTEMMKDD
ncbi:MAG: hypothetical protein VW518_08075 [Burkholderiaceae bacterium]